MSSKLVLTKGRLMKKGNGKELVEVTKEEEDEINKKLAKNPRANTPVVFYEMVASSVKKLTKKEFEYTDEKITEIDNYFDAQNGSTKRTDRNERPQVDEGFNPEEEDDLPF